MNLRYTICFIIDEETESVLMLLRNRPPRRGLWNGLGGKIDGGELTRASALREVYEQAGIRLNSLTFAGVLTWEGVPEAGGSSGMYVYLASLPDGFDRESVRQRETEEGVLDWLPLGAIRDRTAPVVENLPHFLPPMMEDRTPLRYHCIYEGASLKEVRVEALAPESIRLADRQREGAG